MKKKRRNDKKTNVDSVDKGFSPDIPEYAIIKKVKYQKSIMKFNTMQLLAYK